MSRRWGPAARALALAASLAALLLGGVARAQGLRIAAEPGFTHTETEIVDQAGTTSEQTIDLLTQSYRLSYDRQLTDRLSASAGGTYYYTEWDGKNDGGKKVASGVYTWNRCSAPSVRWRGMPARRASAPGP